MSRTLFALGGIIVLMILGCDAKPSADATPPAPLANISAGSATPSVAQQVAHLFVGLIADAHNRPNANALETFGRGFGWQKTPDEVNALVNAKVGYAGSVAGATVIVGSDGTNNIMAFTLRDHFAPAEMLAELRQVYTLRLETSDTSDGQHTEMFMMLSDGKPAGLLTLAYGVAKAIQGAGSVGYISIERARQLMPDLRE